MIRTISILLAVLIICFSPLCGDAQMGKKRKKSNTGIDLEDARIFKNDAVDVEFKIPKKWKARTHKGKGRDLATVQATSFVSMGVSLSRFPRQTLEDAREALINSITKQMPKSTHRIFRGKKYGGMRALSVRFEKIGSGGEDTILFTILDVPYHGLVEMKFRYATKDQEKADKIYQWIMSSFRMSGKEGEDLLFQPRVVHYGSGLSYRVPLGVKAKQAPAAAEGEAEGAPKGPIYEGTGAGGAYYKIEKVDGGSDGKLAKLMKDWGGGAKAVGDGTVVKPLIEGGEAICLKFPQYSGRPERAFGAVRVKPDVMFRIEVTGGPNPMQDAERMTATVNWHDIAKEEAEVQGWDAELTAAIKAKKDRKIRKIGRRLVKRYYLNNTRALCHDLLKKGEERAQIYAMEALGLGGRPPEDFKKIRACIDASKFKERTKMRIKGCEALGNMVEFKVTNYLLRKVRDKDTKVAKAAVLALGNHHGNRKKVIPAFVTQWGRVLKDGEKKDPKKQMRRSRLADAFRVALTSLTDTEIKDVTQAKEWLSKNRKVLSAEEFIKIK